MLFGSQVLKNIPKPSKQQPFEAEATPKPPQKRSPLKKELPAPRHSDKICNCSRDQKASQKKNMGTATYNENIEVAYGGWVKTNQNFPSFLVMDR